MNCEHDCGNGFFCRRCGVQMRDCGGIRPKNLRGNEFNYRQTLIDHDFERLLQLERNRAIPTMLPPTSLSEFNHNIHQAQQDLRLSVAEFQSEAKSLAGLGGLGQWFGNIFGHNP